MVKENICFETPEGKTDSSLLVNYREFTSFTAKLEDKNSFLEKGYRIALSLAEISDLYQIVSQPMSKNIPLLEFSSLEWKIYPLKSEFNLIFNVQIYSDYMVSESDQDYHPTDDFSILLKCKAKKPYKLKQCRHWFINQQHWVVPAIVSIVVSLVITLIIQKWW